MQAINNQSQNIFHKMDIVNKYIKNGSMFFGIPKKIGIPGQESWVIDRNSISPSDLIDSNNDGEISDKEFEALKEDMKNTMEVLYVKAGNYGEIEFPPIIEKLHKVIDTFSRQELGLDQKNPPIKHSELKFYLSNVQFQDIQKMPITYFANTVFKNVAFFNVKFDTNTTKNKLTEISKFTNQAGIHFNHCNLGIKTEVPVKKNRLIP